jgi:hypothetical protein
MQVRRDWLEQVQVERKLQRLPLQHRIQQWMRHISNTINNSSHKAMMRKLLQLTLSNTQHNTCSNRDKPLLNCLTCRSMSSKETGYTASHGQD